MIDNILSGKTIILGVAGGIAAYKGVDLASKLTQEGAIVKTIMTQNATKFVGPITFQSVTGQSVVTDLFGAEQQGQIQHVSLSEEADLVVVAPATANIIAKAAHGLADDALSTIILAARSTVVMVPAMNNHMWFNKATQDNMEILKSRGVRITDPEVGRLACGEEQAVGRFPKTEAIIDYLKNLLAEKDDLVGKTILVTAGGTHEPIDPVRFIGNRSSGKMGYAVAEAAKARGADVVLVSGPSCLSAPRNVKVINIETARQMCEAVMDNLDSVDAVIMSAAVADFRPANPSGEKIKKEKMSKSIELELNPDILQLISDKKDEQLVVGFAAESENVVDNALKKIDKKKLDLMVANDISKEGVGFGSDLNLAVLIDKNGPMGELETYQKTELADKILDWLVKAFKRA